MNEKEIERNAGWRYFSRLESWKSEKLRQERVKLVEDYRESKRVLEDLVVWLYERGSYSLPEFYKVLTGREHIHLTYGEMFSILDKHSFIDKQLREFFYRGSVGGGE